MTFFKVINDRCTKRAADSCKQQKCNEGTLTCASAVGQGTKFTVALPQSAARVGRSSGRFNPADRERLYTADFRARIGTTRPDAWFERAFLEAGDLDPASAAMAVDLRTLLPYQTLPGVEVLAVDPDRLERQHRLLHPGPRTRVAATRHHATGHPAILGAKWLRVGDELSEYNPSSPGRCR